MGLRPLDGFTIGVTAGRRAEEQAELLARRGASVVFGPSISTLYLASDDDLGAATLQVVDSPPHYLVASTGIGMRAWVEAATAAGVGDRLLAALAATKVVARGPKAAGATEGLGLTVWRRCASERLAEVEEVLLAEDLAGTVVAIQEHGLATPDLGAALRAAGATVVEIPVYRWHVPADAGPARRLVEEACAGRVNAITFTSAPAVHNLFAIADDAGTADGLRSAFDEGLVAACVGPVCAEAAAQEGVAAPVAPQVGRLGLLVRTLSDHFADRRRVFRSGDAELVVQGSAVEADGVRADLRPVERAVFEVLAAREGAVVSRSTLLARVWGSSDVDPHVIEVTVGRLRRRLGRCGEMVATTPGRGYRLLVSA